jgi:hypothetical protein
VPEYGRAVDELGRPALFERKHVVKAPTSGNEFVPSSLDGRIPDFTTGTLRRMPLVGNTLDDAPGHLFLKHESSDLQTFFGAGPSILSRRHCPDQRKSRFSLSAFGAWEPAGRPLAREVSMAPRSLLDPAVSFGGHELSVPASKRLSFATSPRVKVFYFSRLGQWPRWRAACGSGLVRRFQNIEERLNDNPTNDNDCGS